MKSQRYPTKATRRICTRLYFVSLLFSLLVTGITQAETGKQPDSRSVARGKQLYDAHCVACHKRDGVGEPTVPWSIRRAGFIEAMPLNETSHAWHHGDEQLIDMILDGTSRSRTRMPVWRNILSEQNAADLVAYMKSLWSDRIVSCQGPKHMGCM
jgi:mono/diheme cytochrome c family protein